MRITIFIASFLIILGGVGCDESGELPSNDDDIVDDDDTGDDDTGDDDTGDDDTGDDDTGDDDTGDDDTGDDDTGDDDTGDDDDDDDDDASPTTVVLVQNLVPPGCSWNTLEFAVEQDGLGIGTISVAEAGRPFGMIVEADHLYQLDLNTAPDATCDDWGFFATYSGTITEDCYYLMSIAADGASTPAHWLPGSLAQCEGVDYVADQVRIAFTEGTLASYAQSQIEGLGLSAVQTVSDPPTFLVTSPSGTSAPEMTLELAGVDQLLWVAPDPL